MTEVTKTVRMQTVWGNMKVITYAITNLVNATTITTPFKKISACWGVNETTADKPFGRSISGGVVTAIVSTTTDEYEVTVVGK